MSEIPGMGGGGRNCPGAQNRIQLFPVPPKLGGFQVFQAGYSAALLLSAPQVWCWIFSEDEAVPGGFPGAELELRAAGGGAGKGRACVCVSLSEPHKLC